MTSSPLEVLVACPACGGDSAAPVLAIEDIPVIANVLWPTRELALAAPRGDIRLTYCADCGALRNAGFDADRVRYSPSYENSLHFSAAFDEWARGLARRLVGAHDIRGRRVVDVGCGAGDFLRMLCEEGGNRGVGYDPSYPGETDGGNPAFVRGYYAGEPADFITCRHVLEHVEVPGDLLRTLDPGATVYFEVPDGGHMLRENAIWELIYEHVWYFTAPALRRLFEAHGYRVLETGSSFGGQYLYLEAVPAGGPGPQDAPTDDLEPLVGDFARRHAETIAAWERRLGALHADGRRVAVWGAGAKGVSFLHQVAGGERVAAVVDINARKQGRFVPGTGQEVRAPASLAEDGCDVVLAMNGLYADEIRGELARLGVDAGVLTV